MPTLYVTEPGARVEKEYRRLLVTLQDKVLLAVPAARVSHLVLVGNVGITTPALYTLLAEDVGLSLLERDGELRGRLAPPTGKNVLLRQAQYARAQDPAFCLAVGRAIVGGKLRNYRALARRLARAHPSIAAGAIECIGDCIRRLPAAPNHAALRGLEGLGSRLYFALWRQALAPDVAFSSRTRRPPGDPCNALLSLGYSLLTDNLITACEIAGLDPYDGFYHADKYGRPALALDLVEEFRGVIADVVALNMFNRRIVQAADFEPGPKGGWWLKQGALRTYLRQYTARLNTKVQPPGVGRSITYQKCMEMQAQRLRQAIEQVDTPYQPFLTR